MKKIIFVRHAKSSWSSGVSRDFDRPLNQRGLNDAPKMAAILSKLVPQIDGIIKSPSQRTTETAKYFIKQYAINESFVISDHSLYHGSLNDILDAVKSLPDEWNNVILFAHNPGMTSVAEYFGNSDVNNVPTCGISVVESSTNDWAYLNNENSKIVAFEYPKKYNS